MIEIEYALSYIPSDDRETWVEMGMAIKSELGDNGFEVWDRWSQQSERYKARDMRPQWRSFRTLAHGITIGTLFHAARERGWKGSGTRHIEPRRVLREDVEREEAKLRAARQSAAIQAAKIKQDSEFDHHPYLARKGFKDRKGLVWSNGGQRKLVVPMYVGSALRNVQLIAEDGDKKFLTGGQAGGCEYLFDGAGLDVLCEGYATGLSVHVALTALRLRHRLHVAFSAHNMVRIARSLRGGFVIADNDQSGTGEKVAREIGWPFWMSTEVGEDANDAHRRLGLFKFSQSLRAAMKPP